MRYYIFPYTIFLMTILIVSSIDIQLINSFKYWYEDLSDIIILSNKFYYDYDRDEIFIFYYPIPPLEIKNETLYTIIIKNYILKYMMRRMVCTCLTAP